MGGPLVTEECMKEWRIQVSAFTEKTFVAGFLIVLSLLSGGSDFKHIFQPFTPEEGACG